MAANPDLSPSLYRRSIGEAFDSLPTVLQRFHGEPTGGTAQGTVRVTRGPGWLRHAAATVMRLPPPGEQVPILLEVRAKGGVETWTRTFGTTRLITRQWYHDGLLIEAAGPMQFGFRLLAEATGMRFQFVYCRFCGLRLPSALSPHVEAFARGQEASWWVEVRIEVPVLGMLTRYEGEVTPQC